MTAFARSFALLAAILFTFGCDDKGGSTPTTGSTTGTPAGAGKKSLVVIPKGTTHVFWQTVKAGAEEAGNEAGYEVMWKGPLEEEEEDQRAGSGRGRRRGGRHQGGVRGDVEGAAEGGREEPADRDRRAVRYRGRRRNRARP